jgi:hypothetical protein
MQSRVPITRLGKFFGSEDFELEVDMGQEWLIGDINFTCVLYRIDKSKNKIVKNIVFIPRPSVNV